MMSMDENEATRQMERAAQAEIKRQQNVMPAWHLKSTITGDLTALGVQENARTESNARINGSGDEILKGLGVVGGRTETTTQVHVVEDVKPTTTNSEVDYYDQYYASLAASSSGVASAQATPSNLSHPESSDFGDLAYDDEEDRKPNVEYLDSLNDYRKRSRSKEDEGVNGKTKVVKVDETKQNGHGYENGIAPTITDAVLDDAQEQQLLDDDPVVYVNGKPVPYSGVTEEDHDIMTPDEYTAFFEIMQARS